MSRCPEAGAALAVAFAVVAGLPAPAEAEPEAVEPAAFEIGDFDLDGIGREAAKDEIEGWNIDVRYDGEGLPEGRGTALEGEDLYVQLCSACHGDFGEGAGRWPKLSGGLGTLGGEDPVKTVGSYWPHVATLIDYTYRAMPYGFGQSLTPDELYAISAYVLFLNDIILDEELELSHSNVMDIEMPNVDGFIPDDRDEVEAHFWQDDPCMEGCRDGAAEIVGRAMVLDVTPDGGEGAPSLD